MQIYKNLLSPTELSELKDIMVSEIEANPNLLVPKHQSHYNMHEVYASGVVQHLLSIVTKKVNSCFNGEHEIINCWFNLVNESSDSLGEEGFHIHPDTDSIAVFYVQNCHGNGTIIRVNDVRMQIQVDDNSLTVFKGSIDHAIPEWHGKPRLSVAFDFKQIV